MEELFEDIKTADTAAEPQCGINESVRYIKQASAKAQDKIYLKYENERRAKANVFNTEMLISKFASRMRWEGMRQ